jgi:hypothetical protein
LLSTIGYLVSGIFNSAVLGLVVGAVSALLAWILGIGASASIVALTGFAILLGSSMLRDGLKTGDRYQMRFGLVSLGGFVVAGLIVALSWVFPATTTSPTGCSSLHSTSSPAAEEPPPQCWCVS